MKKILCLTLALLMTLVLFAGCGGGSGGGQSEENVLRIGVYQPLTGENGGGGLQELYGVRYAHSKFPTVTIGGVEYKIELVERDNKSDKTEAVTAAQSLIAEDITIALGTYGSSTAIAGGPIFEEAKIPVIGASCTNPQVTIGNDYYFRICFTDPFQGTVMANYAIQNGLNTAAVISQLGDDYTAGLAAFFVDAYEALGGTVVSEQQFQKDQTEFKAILTNIKAVEPDFIFAPSSQTVAPLVIRQARELDITAQIGAGDTWDNATVIDNAGADAEGIVFSTFFDEAEPANDIAAEFIVGFKEYLVENGENDVISAFSALGYDSYLVALAALEKAGSTDGEAIQQALVDLDFEGGVTGRVTFDENGDANKDLAYIKTVRDGKFVFLEIVTIA